jgi:hypothetical protein
MAGRSRIASADERIGYGSGVDGKTSRKRVHQPTEDGAAHDHDQKCLEKEMDPLGSARAPQKGEEHRDKESVKQQQGQVIHQLFAPLAMSETSRTVNRFIRPAV